MEKGQGRLDDREPSGSEFESRVWATTRELMVNREAIPHFGYVSESQRDLIYATQGPANAVLFEARVDAPAWKNKPSWYLAALKDGTINTEQERFIATHGCDHYRGRFQSRSSDFHPDAVVGIIKQASEASAR
jgi:hypothetical protein